MIDEAVARHRVTGDGWGAGCVARQVPHPRVRM